MREHNDNSIKIFYVLSKQPEINYKLSATKTETKLTYAQKQKAIRGNSYRLNINHSTRVITPTIIR
jgi:hypothetical protein